MSDVQRTQAGGRPVTAAVVGCGDVSVVHLEALRALPGSELVAVCDVDPAAASTASKRYGVPAYGDHRRLLEEVRPDVVHISTPHHQHAAVAVDCLERGVHVILEKPVAHRLAEAQLVVEAAERSPGTKIGICFQNRYNATVQAIRTMIDSGQLGRVLGGSGTVLWHRTPEYYRSRPWRGRRDQSGGGVLINQAIHTVDLLQWLLGEVTAVRGRVDTYALADVIDVEDSAQLLLEHGSDGVRSVFCATNAHVVDAPVTLEVVAERATLFLRGDLTITWDDGRTEVVPERRVHSSGRSYWGVSHQQLIADFYARLDDPEPFWISPSEGLKSLRILDAAYALG
jgi:UDP-N-acetyl-2-amino-2-deoxyglucuronate dehydrogenase